jgi:putative ABC transport system permease protein
VWKVVDGRAPTGPDEVALDAPTAEDNGFVVGDSVKVNSEGGSRRSSSSGSPSSTSCRHRPTRHGRCSTRDGERVRREGGVRRRRCSFAATARCPTRSWPTASRRRSTRTRTRSREALTGLEITEQTPTEIERGLSFFTFFLSIFSFIALGVGCFVIYNVFSISAAQRDARTRCSAPSARAVGR